MQVELEVVLQDGTKRRSICNGPPGSWGRPIDAAQHRAKVQDCLSVGLHGDKLEQALELLDSVERLSAGGVGRLATILAGME